MKTLVLVRHAKSSWDDPNLPDHDRPLDARGKRDAPMMAKRLAQRGVKPDAMRSSTAKRARKTAKVFADELEFDEDDIVLDPRLYAASQAAILAVLAELPDDVQVVCVFGHNPEFSDLAQRFAPKWPELPTCAVAEFDFDVKRWSQLGEATPTRASLDTPK